jgi:hypothetical protein
LHHHVGPLRAGLAILDLPLDLVGELHEPLDPVVAVDDRQDELLGGRAVEAVLADRHHRGVPGDVAAREVGEQVERRDLALVPGSASHEGLVLGHVGEHAVHREAHLVGADLLVAGDARPSGRRHTACG